MQKCIKTKETDKHSILSFKKHLKCHNITAHLLSNRQFDSIEKAKDFLFPSLKNIKSPSNLFDINVAVKRIFKAIVQNEKILIFGDYDVDGITSTTILLDFFNYINRDVSFYIPNRLEEGYSLKVSHFKKKMMKDVKLIITVDCMVQNQEVIEEAQKRDIEIIMTDHHEVPKDDSFKTLAFVNPKREECSSGLKHLAGVGVAFYLIIAIRKYLRDKEFWAGNEEPNLKNYCELVALGTIADIVPLIDENRVFSRIGFNIMKKTERIGLQELIKVSGIQKENINSEDISFKLTPKINAAGRIDNASIAVDLLHSTELTVVQQNAKKLLRLNSERQKIERKTLIDIIGYLKNNPQKLDGEAIILANSSWHNGVLGIVASRIAKRYGKPALLIAIKDNMGKGSARSVKGFDLYEALYEIKEYMNSFGGHLMAAGFTIKKENIKTFTQKFQKIALQKKTIKPKETVVDYDVNFDELEKKFLNELELFQPFGMGNPEPVFLAKNVKIVSSFLIKDRHLRMHLKQEDGYRIMDAIFFNYSESGIELSENFIPAITFKLNLNSLEKSNKRTQIIIKDVFLRDLCT